MSDSPTELRVMLMLCDAAQSIGGKLYILGGGWTQVTIPPGQPVPMALAVRFTIPWDLANHRFKVRVALFTQEGEEVDLGDGPIEAHTEIEVGRPAGLQPGSPLDASLALNTGALPLAHGRYVWNLLVDDVVHAFAPFWLKSPDQ